MDTIYNVNGVKISVSVYYSEHQKVNILSGCIYGVLECGGSSHAGLIRQAMKQHAEKHGLKINGKISHLIYGDYTATLTNP